MHYSLYIKLKAIIIIHLVISGGKVDREVVYFLPCGEIACGVGAILKARECFHQQLYGTIIECFIIAYPMYFNRI